MTGRYSYFAPCPAGVEPFLADELRRLGIRGVRPQRSGVLFTGGVAEGLRALYWTRLASRVLLTLASVDASSAEALYDGVRELRWEDHMTADGTLAVDAGGTNDALRNTQFTAVKVKDAIADRFRDLSGGRPSVDVRDPDLRINVAVRSGKATISLDLAGQPLHKRGYREQGIQVEAPMKETLAAAVLEAAGWREIAEADGAFLDPMCGSGTLAIEAALMAAEIAPGLIRPSHPVQRWLGFDAEAWARMVSDAERRREAGLSRLPVISASDHDPRAVDIARRCAARAGLEFLIDIERRDIAELEPPSDATPGLIATNPPWGERLSDRAELPALYSALGSRLGAFEGWRLAVVSPDPALAKGLGLVTGSALVLGSGKGVATVTTFPELGPKAVALPPSASQGERREQGASADAFENRLRKMAKHYGKWARRAGVTCYRVYDADLPDYALAVDLYEGTGPDAGRRWAHLAEYAPPAGIDPDRASARLDTAVAIAAESLEVEEVFVKRRERQRGTAQYERVEARGATGVVAENGLLFEVNLSDYLDTGLFLDHRDTRAWVRELAPDKRFLNLFAYTGTASVYAAAGGARETTTVDLSATYLEWAQRNLALNGFDGAAHRVERDDTFAWLHRARQNGRKFDLVFCDPPTFSSSKRMDGTFDVQRDHVRLLHAIHQVLAENGLVIFSCNRRSFTLEEVPLTDLGFEVRDVTARTIPKDFEQRPGVHRCWTLRTVSAGDDA